MVLAFRELPDEDRPPEEIWLDPEELNAHAERVSTRRRSSSTGAGPMEPIEEETHTITNALTRAHKR